jgi:hypothetical protein
MKGRESESHGVGNDQATGCWRATIDAALEPADCVRETGKA